VFVNIFDRTSLTNFPDLLLARGLTSTLLQVLTLDGGGVRGIIEVLVLEAIQKAAGKSISECFDWVGGTSTGGLLALSIMQGR